jgi:hypothetical protein
MADIHYTAGNDTIDLSMLRPDQLRDIIYAGTGDDTILGTPAFNGIVLPGPGNDTVRNVIAVSYWSSPAGVTVNLAEGYALDGEGGRDTLVGIANVHGSGSNDVLIGSASNEWFTGTRGNDLIDGGGGDDTVYLPGKPSDYAFTFDDKQGRVLAMHAGKGELTTLISIENLSFDNGLNYRTSTLRYELAGSHFAPEGKAIPVAFTSMLNALPVDWKIFHSTVVGDFSGDGVLDVLLHVGESLPVGTSGRTSPTQGRFILLEGRGDGTFIDGTQRLPDGGDYHALVRNLVTGDFNGDGRLDFAPASNYEDGRVMTAYLSYAAPQFAFLSNTRGGFDKIALNHNGFAHGIASADYNKDGKDDLFIGGFTTNPETQANSALFLSGQQSGIFTRMTLSGFSVASTNLLLDLNGDQRLDFIGGGRSGGHDWSMGVETRLQQADGSLGSPVFMSLPYVRKEMGRAWGGDPTEFAIASMDGKEFADTGFITSASGNFDSDIAHELLFVRNGFGMHYVNGVLTELGAPNVAAIEIYDLSESGQLLRKETTFNGWDTSNWFFFIQVIDFNGDGHTDVYVQSYNRNGKPAVFINDGMGRFDRLDDALLPEVKAPGEIFQMTSIAGDFNQDGLMDVLIRPLSVTGQQSIEVPLATVHLATQRLFTGPGYTFPAAAPGFNEQFYLAEYAQAAQAVMSGQYVSGLAHYLAAGKADGLRGFAPSTTIHGSANIDTVTYTGNVSEYEIRQADGKVIVKTTVGSGSTDSLNSIERLHFRDSGLAFDLKGDQSAGQTARIVGALLDTSRLTPEVAGIGIRLFDQGHSMLQVAQLILDHPIYLQLAGSSRGTDLVKLLFQNLLGVAPSADEFALYVGLLDRGELSGAELAVAAAESSFNEVNIGLVGLQTHGLAYAPVSI